jgi:hypothetical protein
MVNPFASEHWFHHASHAWGMIPSELFSRKARSSAHAQGHILEHLGADFKVSLLHLQMCHGGLNHVLGTYV